VSRGFSMPFGRPPAPAPTPVRATPVLKPRLNDRGDKLGGSAKRKRRGRRPRIAAAPVCPICGDVMTETRRGWLRCATHRR
jgi:hypothetical protein